MRLHSRDGKELHRAETAVIKKTLSPQWGKRFRFRGKLRNYVHGMLELKVRNSDRLAVDNYSARPALAVAPAQARTRTLTPTLTLGALPRPAPADAAAPRPRLLPRRRLAGRGGARHAGAEE